MKTAIVHYALVLIIVFGLVMISFFTHIEANRLKVLNHVLSNPNCKQLFTENGRKDVSTSYSFFSNQALSFYVTDKDLFEMTDEDRLRLLSLIIKDFPKHLVNTRRHDNVIEYDAVFNGHEPILITFILKKEEGIYKINGIGNLKKLIRRINLSFKE